MCGACVLVSVLPSLMSGSGFLLLGKHAVHAAAVRVVILARFTNDRQASEKQARSTSISMQARID